MRAVSDHRFLAMLGFCLTLCAVAGCADLLGYDTPSWWDAKGKAAKAAELAKYGTTPDQRIDVVRDIAKRAPTMSPEEQQKQAAEMQLQIRGETDPLVRMHIVRAMGMMHCPTASAVMTAALQDKEPDVRLAACQAWAKQKTPEAAQVLAGVVNSDTNFDVQLAAIKGLSTTGDPLVAKRALGIALENRDPAMQARAVASLKVVSGKDLGPDVNKWREYVRSEVPALPAKPPESLAARSSDLLQ